MTTPSQQARIALSEIPSRLDILHFDTTTPAVTDRRSPDYPMAGTIVDAVRLLDNTTNIALAQEYILSSAPSPDELVIRQRGRRRFIAWSPEQAAAAATATPARSPFQHTPTKMPFTSSMILRSSPRKRLTMGNAPPLPMPPIMPSPTKAKQQLWPDNPMKKPRLDDKERCLAQQNIETPLAVLLQGMSREQLIGLIVGELVGDNEQVEEKLRALLPLPDIIPMEEDLLHAKRNIFRSLPTSRLCRKTDSSAYSRAALHLNEFKRLLGMHTKRLYDATHWDVLLDYVTMAWPCVRATPNWDNVAHNVVRRQCFKLLSCHCTAAVKYGGLRLGMTRLLALENNLRTWIRDSEDVLPCLNALNKILAKRRATL